MCASAAAAACAQDLAVRQAMKQWELTQKLLAKMRKGMGKRKAAPAGELQAKL